MKRCDPRAYARCPDRERCGLNINAYFAEGSECDKFNQKILEAPMTNADRIRALSDEELAEWIYNGVSSDPCDYCEHNNGYCDGVPCKGKAHAEIIAERLQQPAEEEAK